MSTAPASATTSRGRVVTIGLPAETKDGEHRIALTPSGVDRLLRRGHRLRVQAGAGAGAGFADSDYEAVGAQLVDEAAPVWDADIVVKVKEPQPREYPYLRRELVLFAFLHLAAAPGLTRALLRAGTRAYAFETLTDGVGLPLLAPMSEIAGRTAAIVGATTLSSEAGGSGTLLGGTAGVPPARAVVIGLGVAGTMAARGLRGLDAHVLGVDIDPDRLRERHLDGTVSGTQVSEPVAMDTHVRDADLLIGAALVPGARAPEVVSEQQIATMRPGSVVVDLAIDQGGCIATSRPTSLSEPTFVRSGVVHYCVTNVPAQYPRTASAALSAVLVPRLQALADDLAEGRAGTDAESSALAGACNVAGGELVHPTVGAAYPDEPAATRADADTAR